MRHITRHEIRPQRRCPQFDNRAGQPIAFDLTGCPQLSQIVIYCSFSNSRQEILLSAC